MISSRKSSSAPSILGWPGATVRRMKVGAPGEPNEGRGRGGLAWPFSEPRIWVGRANAGFFAAHANPPPAAHKGGLPNAPPQRRRVRSVEQFDVVDVVGVVAADILLG